MFTLSYVTKKTCSGPGDIYNVFFTEYKSELAVSLLIIFNTSLTSEVFPDKWKISYVSPVFKEDDISLVTNYCPLSIISIIFKIFKNIVYKKICPLFK